MGVQDDCVHAAVPEGLGVAWLCGLLWGDLSLSMGVIFPEARWFLISLSPATLEIITSPKISQIHLCCQSPVQMLWR